VNNPAWDTSWSFLDRSYHPKGRLEIDEYKLLSLDEVGCADCEEVCAACDEVEADVNEFDVEKVGGVLELVEI
jgi:hypothetical protein